MLLTFSQQDLPQWHANLLSKNHRMSALEADKLIDELLTLDNPYNCPHGRPTIIAMTKTEIEKKFKRIV